MKKPFFQGKFWQFVSSIWGGAAKKVEDTVDHIKQLSPKEIAVLAVEALKKMMANERLNAFALETSWEGDERAIQVLKQWLPKVSAWLNLIGNVKPFPAAAFETATALRAMYPNPKTDNIKLLAGYFLLAQEKPELLTMPSSSATVAKAVADVQEAYVEMKATQQIA